MKQVRCKAWLSQTDSVLNNSREEEIDLIDNTEPCGSEATLIVLIFPIKTVLLSTMPEVSAECVHSLQVV